MKTITISEDEYAKSHYERMALRSRRALSHDIVRAFRIREDRGLTSISIPPSASIGEIEDLIDLMLAAPRKRGEQ